MSLDLLKDPTVLSIVTSYAWTGSPYVLPSAMAKAATTWTS